MAKIGTNASENWRREKVEKKLRKKVPKVHINTQKYTKALKSTQNYPEAPKSSPKVRKSTKHCQRHNWPRVLSLWLESFFWLKSIWNYISLKRSFKFWTQYPGSVVPLAMFVGVFQYDFGPQKHVLHLVWRCLEIYEALKTALNWIVIWTLPLSRKLECPTPPPHSNGHYGYFFELIWANQNFN